jgi:transcriptional regulator with XRE-family HTH domain
MQSNKLLASQPYSVERALKTVGNSLRTARRRRGLTMVAAAQKIGTGYRAVMDAERGKPSTGVAVYAALLWLYDLLPAFEDLANPVKDAHGLALARRKQPMRARKARGLNNDF